MSLIELKNVSKYWGDVRAVEKLNINIEEGEFVVLLGPSGCGKSTTLRLIAGLENVSSGGIFIGGKNVNNIDPSSRNISMVFQSYALFPHLNVEENIIFGLKVRKVKKGDRQVKLKNVAEKVGLSNLLKRKPAELSGGQRQRVALARAIISENPICLMDEPLSNLDAKLRHQMRSEIRSLQKDLNITLIYVTHDQTEAMSMADKIVLLNEGEIVQQGRPKELYEKPENTFTAKFLGNPPMNLINLEVEREGNYIPIFEEKYFIKQKSDKKNILGIRPEDIEISKEGIKCTINDLDYQGSDVVLSLQLGNQEIFARIDSKKVEELDNHVYINWDNNNLHLFDFESGVRDVN
jgi:sn-glycerol 3-phosphate transport system ATP-binding protein|tara:strand:- start:3257 stop:4306 length:1050 start_codon:yes stop_codon:yes gene_type:complete